MDDMLEEHQEACMAVWDEQGGEEEERRPEREPGPDPAKIVRPFAFTFTLCEMGACRVLSKGISGLICFNRIALSSELRVA